MAKKYFSWENFSYNFIKGVVYGKQTPRKIQPISVYNESEFDHLIPYINRICPYPDEAFVRRYRDTIEDYFLNGTNYLIEVTKKLSKLNYGGISIGSNEDMLFALRSKRMTQTLCDAYLFVLRMAGKNVVDDDESLFTFPKTVDLTSADSDDIPLFPYQTQAVSAMEDYYLDNNQRSAILCMPTGSGKTRTSVYFLLKDLVSRGYQIIWLCHRSMLLEQAAEQFYRFSPIINRYNPKKEQFKMVCISGKHSTVRALQKDDDLIVSTVQSLCNNTDYLPNILSDKVMIVVDEAHHTLAPSYRRIIKAVRSKCSDAKLLGLTATPVRLTDRTTGMLMKLFDNKVVYSVSMSDLIANGTLAKPNYIPKQTNIDIEAIINVDERKYIQKWGELPETLITKVAKTNERNEFIVDEYVRNKDKYGKTIIFALNAIHCDSLNEQFKKQGIRSGYVYTMIGNAENQRTIERFRHNERDDGLDVLININILTEGSDIPDIQTVFLTRPTSSDVLLMQMVGRGMRGIGCGGTETVNIVDFCDKWSSITCWLNPKFIVGEEDPDYQPIYINRKTELIPIDAIRDIVKGITYKGEFKDYRMSTLPVGWYDVIDEDGNDSKVIVFENQLEGYENFKNDTEKYIGDNDTTPGDIIGEYFRMFGMLPSEDELDNMLMFIKKEGEFPAFNTFEDRDKIEPLSIAKIIKNDNLSYIDIVSLIENTIEMHKDLILSLYGSKEYYRQRISECLIYPKGIVPVLTRVEEVEKSFYKLSQEPLDVSIDDLLTEVIEEQSENFPEDFTRPEIYWTQRPAASYFGLYYHTNNRIFINALLNSISVPKEVVKFVIYHECLHQEFTGHPKEFREKEHLYPNFQEHQNFLDYTLKDFELDFEL